MLEGLCGNKNIEKVLLFIFVNRKCYGAQLQRLLKTPLTSLQNALGRLENGGVIECSFEGKTKVYKLNPNFPLHNELEHLLKMTYTLLPPEEKKRYSLVHREELKQKNREPQLSAFWDKLREVKQFTRHTHSRSHEEKGWTARGLGEVQVISSDPSSLVFHERGTWQGKHSGDINFSNIFRWTLDKNTGLISLEHLRFGPEQPVFLFHLAPTGNYHLASVDAHLCKDDIYLATVPWDDKSIRLNWRVIGPKKNEEMEYCYT